MHTRSLADFITIMCGFRFSVHTPFEIHLQSLDKRTRSIQTQTYPAHLGAGTAFSRLLEKQTPATGTDRRSRLPG